MTIMNMVGGGADDRWAEGTPLIPLSNAVTELEGFACLSVSTDSEVFRKGSRITLTDKFSSLGAKCINVNHSISIHGLNASDIKDYLNVVFNEDGECLSNLTSVRGLNDTMTLISWTLSPDRMNGVPISSLNGVTAWGDQVMDGEYTFEGMWTIVYGNALSSTFFKGDYPKSRGRLTAVGGDITTVTFDSGQSGYGHYYTIDDTTASMTKAVLIFTRLNKQ